MATKLDRELRQLGSMSRDELVERWRAAYGCPPPIGARRDLLMYAAGWHIQVKRLGGITGEVRRMLRSEVERLARECRTAQSVSAGACDGDRLPLMPADDRDAIIHDLNVSSSGSGSLIISRRKLMPGARLLRNWNGRTHSVDVTESGYLYEGKTYRSLSAIARQITGSHWSGPRFFGL